MTGNEVFAYTMALIDSVNESTGEADISDNLEYKVRTLPIINVLKVRLYPYSDTYKSAGAGKRPILPVVKSLDDDIGLDNGLCEGVLPYGLAYELLKDENPAVANVMLQLFEELIETLAKGVPAEWEPIHDVYGGIELGEFGRWG